MILIEELPAKKTSFKTSLFVSFTYSPEIVEAVKSIGDYFYDPKTHVWELPCTKLSALIDNLTYLDSITLKILDDSSESTVKQSINYRTKPLQHQNYGISWLINRSSGLLLDQPGLGKTLDVLYAAEELKNQKGIQHCLVVCGVNTVKQNWKREIAKHSTLDCRIIGEKISKNGVTSYTSISDRAKELFEPINEFFVIINIEMLSSSDVANAILSSKNNFDMIVVDEIHKAKNPSSDRVKNLLKLRKVGSYHYGLTGTLLVNKAEDSFVPLKFVGQCNSSFTNFKSYYVIYEKKFGHLQPVGYKNIDTLKNEISECSLRRTKDLLDLPEKIIIPEYVEMNKDQSDFYSDLANGIIEEADRVNIKSSTLLGLITRLRQAATCPGLLTTKVSESCKISRACELVEEICGSGEKVVIFSTFKEPLYQLEKLLGEYNPLICTGDQPDYVVSNNIDKFQNDSKHKVILCTSSKMGVSVTLTAASYGIFIDSTWTPADQQQCEDRIHRLSSTKTVIIYNLIANGTIDERIQEILERKSVLSDFIVDDKVSEEFLNSNNELKELIGIK